MGTAGIKKALIKDAKQNVKPYNDSFLVELGHGNNSFTAYIDKSCLGPGTGNPETTIQGVKWFLVREHVWSSYKRAYSKLSPSEFFEKLTTEEKGLKTFEGNNLIVDVNSFNDGRVGDLGVIHLLIPYSVFPETDQTTALRVVPLGKPQVLYCHFKFPETGYVPLENSETKAGYGQTVNIEVYTHLMPDYRNRSDKFVFDVELINKGTTVAKLEKQEITNREVGTFNYNPTKILKFTIDADWQKNHADKKMDEKFYLKLKGYIGYSDPVLLPADYVAPVGEYDSEKVTSFWRRLENDRWVYDTSNELLVPFDKMSDLLSKFEVEKNNQIQYIGDIRYTQKGIDPCGYSTITIKDESDPDRDALVIFDENDTKNPIDRTAQTFGIITGDERKNISIKLGGLTNKNVLCNGLLLLEPGQKHNEVKHVFQIDRVMPALRDKDGVYVVVQDPQQKGDVDVVPDKQRGPSKDVSDVQQWKEKVDFNFEGEDKMMLMLRYAFNKTFFEGNVGKYPAAIVNQLWLFNYFILTEDLVQTYFVPISTCRYPNQIAKIKVYPNVSWTFHLNYGMKNPLYYRDTWVEMRQHRVEAAVVRAQAADIDGYDGTVETKFGLSIEAKWNKTETAKLDQKISEKVKLIIGSFVKIKQFVDKVTGRDRGNSTEGLRGNVLERVRRIPLSIEVLSPQISIGAGWEYKFGRKEKGQDNILAPTLGLVAKADPVIGAEAIIDLIAWGKKLHPAAEAVITSLDLLAYAANATVRFDLKFYGKLVIEGNIELSKLKKEGTLKAEGQFGFSLTLSAKATGKVKAVIYEADFDFEARAEGKGYFSLGLSAGLDDVKGLYLQPIVRHSGIKITLTFVGKFASTERETAEEFIVIKEDKLDIDKKYYLND